MFHRLTLIGVGLIGSSVARIAHERRDIAGEIVVTARSQKTLDRVQELGFADRVETDAARAVAGLAMLLQDRQDVLVEDRRRRFAPAVALRYFGLR